MLFLLCTPQAQAQTPPDTCFVYGYTWDIFGGPKKGVKYEVYDVRLAGTLLPLYSQNRRTDANGFVWFSLPKCATARIKADVGGFESAKGALVQIPCGEDSVRLDSLQALAILVAFPQVGAHFADSLRTADGRWDADCWLDATGKIDTTCINFTQWAAYVFNHAPAGGGGGSGDITSVIAGNGLKGGATSGAATLDVNLQVLSNGLEIVADSLRTKSTVSLLGQTIESVEITDGTIVNNDINTSAAIVETKLAFLTNDGSRHDHVVADLTNVHAGTILTNDLEEEAHATEHENGGADEISVAGLSGLLADGQTPLAHATSHQNGGADEISVAGLSGLLADGQTPLAHKTSHQDGGTDEVSVTGLSGLLADVQKVTVEEADANPTVNATKVQFDQADGFTVTDETGGQVQIDLSGVPEARITFATNDGSRHDHVIADLSDLPDFEEEAHASEHQDGGADEISVTALSGVLADAQKIVVRKNSGADVGTRSRLNFIEGANVTLTVADDGAGGEVDVTIASTGGGGSLTVEETDDDPTVVATVIQFDQTDGFTVTDEGSGQVQIDFVPPSTFTMDTEWDTPGEVETIWSANILLETEIDAGSELLAILDDETGTGVPVFSISPALTGGPTFGNGATSAGTLRILEDSDDGANYVELSVPALAANRAVIFPDAAGEISLLGQEIALTTETSGNYVASVATTAPLAGGAAGSEGAALTLSVTANGIGPTQIDETASYAWSIGTQSFQNGATLSDANGPGIIVQNSTDAASVQAAQFHGSPRGTPTDSDLAFVTFFNEDENQISTETVRFSYQITDVSNTTEDGKAIISAIVGGTLTQLLEIGADAAGTKIVNTLNSAALQVGGVPVLTANQTIALSGDVSGSGATAITTTIGADKILESMLKAVNAAVDEDILSYESTTGDFEWHTPSELGLAPLASPIFTGTVTIPTPFTLGATSVLPTGAELNFVDGVTSAIQTQLDAKAPLASPALTGTPTFKNGATSSGNFQVFEDSDNGTNKITIQAPASLAADATWEIRPQHLVVAISDETTAITTGTAKITFRFPCKATIVDLRASVNTVSSSGIPTFDINEEGTTIISTKLTIDANEETSVTAAAAYVLSDAAIADDAEMTIDIDTAGTGAKGAKITFYYYPVP